MTRFQVSDRLYGGPYSEEIHPDVDFVVDLTEDGESLRTRASASGVGCDPRLRRSNA